MRSRWALALTAAFSIVIGGAVSASATDPVSLGSGRVLDEAGVLSAADERAIQERSEQLAESSGVDLWVVFVEEFSDPASAEELAARVPALAGRDVAVLIWTTTPWTIPSNLAIAFHPEFDYAAFDVEGKTVIVAEGLAEKVAAAVGRPFGTPVAKMKGAELERIRFQHPLYARPSLGLLGDDVTLEAGTGAVHTAPGHGADVFNTGVKYGLEVYAPIGPRK